MGKKLPSKTAKKRARGDVGAQSTLRAPISFFCLPFFRLSFLFILSASSFLFAFIVSLLSSFFLIFLLFLLSFFLSSPFLSFFLSFYLPFRGPDAGRAILQQGS